METDSTKKSQLNYILTPAGWIRITNVLLGLISIILTLIGFNDDFQERNDVWTPYQTYYGLGYKEEGSNILHLVIICSCFAISTIFFVVLFFVEDASYKWRAWNRFLNLFLAFFLLIGWLCGFMGFLLFRQGCCRVELLSSERISHENDGYNQSCLCMITPHNDPGRSYPVLINQDVPIGLSFINAQSHHHHGHVTALVLVLFNVVMYFGAFLKVS